MPAHSEWVSLGEAAEILGVHPTTVRSWADSGELPSKRTPGGHRRFRRQDLDQWITRRDKKAEAVEAQLILQNVLGRTRLEISGGQLAGLSWYDHLDEDARKKHRSLGRGLLQLLIRYLSSPENRLQLTNEVRQLGAEYARLSLSQALDLAESVRAFLFFRDLLIDSLIQMSEVLSIHTPLDWGTRLQQVNHITDAFLMALIERYEQVDF